MLVYYLGMLNYSFVEEIVEYNSSKCREIYEKKDIGIGDKLGFYDGKKVHICDQQIEQEAKNIYRDLSSLVNINQCYLVLRELIRLHEHIHALIHFKTNYKWYTNLPKEINEPLTVYFSWLIVRSVGDEIYQRVFDKVNDELPDYYKKWDLIQKRLGFKPSKSDVEKSLEVINVIMNHIKKKDWKNRSFNDFIDDYSMWTEIKFDLD